MNNNICVVVAALIGVLMVADMCQAEVNPRNIDDCAYVLVDKLQEAERTSDPERTRMECMGSRMYLDCLNRFYPEASAEAKRRASQEISRIMQNIKARCQ